MTKRADLTYTMFGQRIGEDVVYLTVYYHRETKVAFAAVCCGIFPHHWTVTYFDRRAPDSSHKSEDAAKAAAIAAWEAE